MFILFLSTVLEKFYILRHFIVQTIIIIIVKFLRNRGGTSLTVGYKLSTYI